MGLDDLVLVANFGSTSLKMDLDSMPDEKVLASARAENIGDDGSFIELIAGNTKKIIKGIDTYQDAARQMLDFLISTSTIDSVQVISSVGYKTVNAGPNRAGCFEMTPKVMEDMYAFTGATPVHNPIYKKGITALMEVMPDAMHIGLFETHFHATMPAKAKTVPIPIQDRKDLGIERLGFHGASHHYIRDYVFEHFGKLKIISAHLGGSSSIDAINEQGISIDTTMGFTPEEGLLMGKRGGNLIPHATAKYIQDKRGFTDKELEDYLTNNCGLKAVSEATDDIGKLYQLANIGNSGSTFYKNKSDFYNTLMGKKDGDSLNDKEEKRLAKLKKEMPIRSKAHLKNRIDSARLACDMLEYNIAKQIGAYDVALGKADMIVFTGGAGEKGTELRENVLDILSRSRIPMSSEYKKHNLEVDASLKAGNKHHIINYFDDNHGPRVAVIPTNENIIVAREAHKLYCHTQAMKK